MKLAVVYIDLIIAGVGREKEGSLRVRRKRKAGVRGVGFGVVDRDDGMGYVHSGTPAAERAVERIEDKGCGTGMAFLGYGEACSGVSDDSGRRTLRPHGCAGRG